MLESIGEIEMYREECCCCNEVAVFEHYFTIEGDWYKGDFCEKHWPEDFKALCRKTDPEKNYR